MKRSTKRGAKPRSSKTKGKNDPEAERHAAVGYGKPPREHQFPPGRSGNPRGRPKGRKNIATLVNEVLFMPVAVSGVGRKKRVPMIHAALIGAAQDALKHDLKALSFLTGLARSFDQPTEAGNAEAGITSDDQSLIAEYFDRIGKAKDFES